jgi:hypothetical protein
VTRGQAILIGSAGALLVLAVAAAVLVWRAELTAGGSRQQELVAATNLTLDVRFGYDPSVFTAVSHDSRAEYPLRLDAEGWSFYGKRIRGLGRMLAKDPAPLLYDFVGSQHLESLERYYRLVPTGEPAYEDVIVNGRLGLHQSLIYRRTGKSRGWPSYFPRSVTGEPPMAELQSIKEYRQRSIESQLAISGGAETAHIEGWALFTANDLFFFLAVSPAPLATEQRAACMAVLDSMRFDALLGPVPTAEAEQGLEVEGGAQELSGEGE